MRQARGIALHCLRKLWIEAKFFEHTEEFGPGLVRAPEPSGDSTRQRILSTLPLIERDDNLVPLTWRRLYSRAGGFNHLDLVNQPRIVRPNDEMPSALLEISDDGGASSGENAHDAASGFSRSKRARAR